MTLELFDPLAAPFRHEGSNGEAVVLIHGFTGTPAHFRPLARVLHEHGYTVNVPLLAGHGTTLADMVPTRADDWLASAASAIREVSDHRRVHLAGLSMGGLLAILLAQRSAASTITTINSPIRVKDKRLFLTPVLHRFRPVHVWPDEEPPDLEPEVAEYWVTYQGVPTRAAAELIMLPRRALRAARRLNRPSLVIQSRTDEWVDPKSALALAAALGPRCRLVWLRHSMHNALFDRERHVIARALLERMNAP